MELLGYKDVKTTLTRIEDLIPGIEISQTAWLSCEKNTGF